MLMDAIRNVPASFRPGVIESVQAFEGRPRIAAEVYLAVMTLLVVGKVVVAHVVGQPWVVRDYGIGEAIDVMRRVRVAVREGICNGH